MSHYFLKKYFTFFLYNKLLQFFLNFRLDNWALSFGKTLYETARAATRFDAIQKVCSILMNSNF